MSTIWAYSITARHDGKYDTPRRQVADLDGGVAVRADPLSPPAGTRATNESRPRGVWPDERESHPGPLQAH
ncbi:hypothetical protein Vau01_122950 [Virgisporangium aurantiacum]|uniref:Uncharacterized protein n=1 Tax=Virgisporangium aurantiacum TaxID=175570 RepID=A0A8J4E7X7_9ACTN|nr:hypothetical protein Vau01_122950 [Virgisporangium aurantiacum]